MNKLLLIFAIILLLPSVAVNAAQCNVTVMHCDCSTFYYDSKSNAIKCSHQAALVGEPTVVFDRSACQSLSMTNCNLASHCQYRYSNLENRVVNVEGIQLSTNCPGDANSSE